MIKQISCALLITLSAAACSGTPSTSKAITSDQYIGAMSALGCKSLQEDSTDASALLKKQGIALADIQAFRKNMSPSTAMDIANEVARRVMACHNVTP